MENYRLAVVIEREENQVEPEAPWEKLVRVPKSKIKRNKFLRELFLDFGKYDSETDGKIKILETEPDGFHGNITVCSHLGTGSMLIYYVDVENTHA